MEGVRRRLLIDGGVRKWIKKLVAIVEKKIRIRN